MSPNYPIPPEPPGGRMHASSSGPVGANEDSPLSHLLRRKADDVKAGMKDLTAASQVLAAETRAINTENERYKGSVVDTAVSAMTSQTDVINGADPNRPTDTRQMSGPGGTIKIEPTPTQPSVTGQALVDPTTAQRNQAIAIGLELGISVGWTTLFHQDIDPLVLAGGVGFIIAAGQAVATKINNRKVK